ncbi:translation initiation factor IF-2-like [Onychostruthus taczanowskii]|uniref:translation initiation factor IF-2-like n=1 Tax=Onychostruthus taczanowskii TaxID=356909 RepID=UPI001B806E4D|nr:translation initiation factor IF-2-like [Onychostruthus taczanowskii]
MVSLSAPLRSCPSALRAAGWVRGSGSLSPQLTERCCRHPGQALSSERCSLRAAQPGCPAPAAQPGLRARPRPVRPRCRSRAPGLSRGEPASGRAGRGLRPGTAAPAGGTAGPPRWLRPLEGKRAPHKRGCPCPAAPGPLRPARPAPAGSAARPRGEQPRVAAAGLGSGPFGMKCPGWPRCRGGRGNPFHRESSQGLWPFQKTGIEPSRSWHGPNPSGDGAPGCCRACRSAHGAAVSCLKRKNISQRKSPRDALQPADKSNRDCSYN